MEAMNLALINSCQDGNLEKAKYALKEGADPNKLDEEGWNALHYASENGFEDIINLLLDNGADVNIENSSGFTPFQIVMLCENYSPIIAASFIAKGADVGSPLHKAILLHDTEEIKYNISNGSYIRSTDPLNNSPLHIAIAVNDLETVSLLLNSNIDIDAKDVYDTTPLHEACALGQIYTVSQLINFGSDIEACDYNGRTALILGAGNAQYDVVELLLRIGANINVQDNFGNTALHYAYENEEFEIANLLLDYGADDTIENEDGDTAVKLIPKYED